MLRLQETAVQREQEVMQRAAEQLAAAKEENKVSRMFYTSLLSAMLNMQGPAAYESQGITLADIAYERIIHLLNILR